MQGLTNALRCDTIYVIELPARFFSSYFFMPDYKQFINREITPEHLLDILDNIPINEKTSNE